VLFECCARQAPLTQGVVHHGPCNQRHAVYTSARTAASPHVLLVTAGPRSHLCRAEIDGAPAPAATCPRNPQSAAQPNACTAAGGACALVRDGFYITSTLLALLGAALFVHFRRSLPALEALPLDAWRGKPARRHK
jgi:Acetyl-coenzyme A transporter 1